MNARAEMQVSRVNVRNLVLGLVMIAAAGLALAMKPTIRLADQGPKIDLETMIPKAFGDWRVDESIVPLQVSPDVQAQLDRLYNQTLGRTYVNNRGERVMLSIAYGGDQGRAMQVHRPEVCYAAQGFQIGQMTKDFIDTQGIKLPVMRVVAKQGARTEPITYWVMIGSSAVRGNLEQGFARLKYGLTGKVPFGMLIRVSTISVDETASYRIEEQFVRDFLDGAPDSIRNVLIGAS